MKRRHSFYPIPLLGKGSDNYKDSHFETDVKIEQDIHNINITIKAKLQNLEIENLLKNGKVVIACHIECPKTCFRRMEYTSNLVESFVLDENDVNGKVEISTFLIAANNLEAFTSNDFAEDYKNISFSIEKGMLLGIGKRIEFDVQKNSDGFLDKPSIFSITKDLNAKEARVDTDDKKIRIYLSEAAYSHCKALSNDATLKNVIYSMLIVPAIMKVFYDLRQTGIESVKDCRWFISLEKFYKSYGKNIEQVINDNEPFEEAQKILNNPLFLGLNDLTVLGVDSDED